MTKGRIYPRVPNRGRYAGINLTGYHPPGHPGAFALKCVPKRKCPGGGPINYNVPGAGHLYQLAFKHESYHTVIWA